MEGMDGSEDIPRLGRYQLLARLGSGGMAEVLLGRIGGPGGGRHVAIKRMRPELTRTPEFVDLFLEEARTAASLGHPNICRIHELASHDGEYYMVLEYLEGVPLSHVLAEQLADRTCWDLGVLIGAIVQAAEGMHHAHEAHDLDGTPLNIVHRDISPPNLFVTDAGVVKVLDFGISKSRASVVRTVTGQIRGKFAYMSPEQLRGEKLDRRSDVFSLGIVLWELCAGRRLFRRVNRLEVFRAIVKEPIPPIREVRPELPELLAHVTDQALARDKDERFDSARAFGAALTAAAREVGGVAPPAVIGARIAERFATELAARRQLLLAPPGLAAAPPDGPPEPPSLFSIPQLSETVTSVEDGTAYSDPRDGDHATGEFARPAELRLALVPDMSPADLADKDTE
jgi:serine/threonine protein kinase